MPTVMQAIEWILPEELDWTTQFNVGTMIQQEFGENEWSVDKLLIKICQSLHRDKYDSRLDRQPQICSSFTLTAKKYPKEF